MIATTPPLASILTYSRASSSSNGSSSKVSSRDFPLASRIFVRNLPYSTGEATLIKLFSKFGQIADVKLARHEGMRTSKGYAFIQYTSQEDAVLALEQMDQKRFGGRTIYAEIAKASADRFAVYPVSQGPPKQLPDTVPAAGKNDDLDDEECCPSHDPCIFS